ncbi:MAG: 23S rRNA (pseudouridine(1915)-N(3))-methyltransferase RlmH [Paracoccaceae bacterium]|nr:23S rRNA (pseudouridine(1915)-N(3))-methyltransferase RlmH [Paracoccaceae bacterium]
MHITICAIGRMRNGPHLDLFNTYQKRFNQNARQIGFKKLNLVEVEDKNKNALKTETQMLKKAVAKATSVFGLDEFGEQLDSMEFATLLKALKNQNEKEISFVIGGADGLDKEFKKSCGRLISFGPMVWPHMLARVMLSEQLYRASTIMLNNPYHRL